MITLFKDMKKRMIVLSLLAAMLLPVVAQEVEVTSQRRLLEGVEGPAYYPVLDETGNRLLFSSENGGLKLHDLADGVTVTVTRDYVAGRDACFGVDGKVYFVTQQMGEDHLIYRTGQRFDAASRKADVVTPTRHGAMRAMPEESGNAAWTEGSRVHVMVGGEERVFSPVDSWAGYLWASLSPDGKRVAFFAAGKGIVVIDLRGQMLAMLGNYEMPCWYNNDYLVAQNAKDDGHQFTSSQIVLLKADGTYMTELTRPASMAMQPTCGGGRIVYTTIDGMLYEMKIKIYE